MMFKRLALAAALLAACVSLAHAQGTIKPKATLNSEVSSSFPDQNAGAITPATTRSALADFIASWQQAPQVNLQTGTSYTVLSTDYGNLVTLNNAAAITVTLPQPSGSLISMNVYIADIGAGTATISATGATINGGSSVTLTTGNFTWLVSDGTGANYRAVQTLTAPVTGSNIASGTVTGSNIASGTVAASNLTLPVPPQGRITLTANTPVMTATASAQTTLRYDCYAGNFVPYFNGTSDLLDTIASCEVTDAMASTGTGVLNANNVFDVWWVHAGANRICIATNGAGGGWASDTGGSNTARGTGYTKLDRVTRGYLTNANALAHCYNGSTDYGSASANQATYLGTIMTDAAAAGSVSYTFGTAASGGGAAVLNVWNYYNRVSVSTRVTDNGATYTYTSNVVRQARASAGNQASFVIGLAEDAAQASVNAVIALTANAGSFATTGIGLDSTTVFDCGVLVETPVAVSNNWPDVCSDMIAPLLGAHIISMNESSDNTHANTFDGFSGNFLGIVLRQ